MIIINSNYLNLMKPQDFTKKLKNTLDKFSVSNNSVFFIHADLGNYLQSSSSIGYKCEHLYKFLTAYFKNHTLIMPTFTYSFCKTGLFDIQKSRSEVGLFSEYFREKCGNFRSDHPILSVCGKGKLTEDIIKNISKSGAGDGSVFERLFVFDAKILFLGADFIKTCTFNHYTEQFLKVNYRYSKYFDGKVIYEDKTLNDSWEFYVKNTEVLKFKDLSHNKYFEKDLIKNKILKKYKIDKFEVSLCSSRDLFDFVKKKLKKNIYYILGSKPKRL